MKNIYIFIMGKKNSAETVFGLLLNCIVKKKIVSLAIVLQERWKKIVVKIVLKYNFCNAEKGLSVLQEVLDCIVA